jgi:hypothetical protein
MSSAITPDQQNKPQPAGLDARVPELAPSRLRDDDQSLPRILGMCGAVLALVGALALALQISGRNFYVTTNPGMAVFLLVLGVCGLLYHAAFDTDLMFRRLYQIAALALLLVGVGLCLVPYPKASGDMLRLGAPLLLVSLLFAVSGLRNEDDIQFRRLLETIFGVAGVVFALTGLIGGSIRGTFLLPVGVVLALFGLLYVLAFVASRGVGDDQGYYTAVGLAVTGVVFTLIALGRSLLARQGSLYFTDFGVVLIAIGLAYAAAGGVLASDSPFFVQLRRELGAFFFSPVTYLVLFGFAFFWFWNWLNFASMLTPGPNQPSLVEPIVRNYLFALFPVFIILFAAPVLTMNLFAEEQRSGTFEVLMTAPVNEFAVVMSKYLAALITYMLCWAPAALYLLAIPMAGGKAFDYKPLLSFFLAVLVSGSGFVSMGLFFSSLTRNGLVAVVLSIAGMGLLTLMFFLSDILGTEDYATLTSHLSYLDQFRDSLSGKITPRFMLFPLSLTIFFLFLTHKVLESRKWR